MLSFGKPINYSVELFSTHAENSKYFVQRFTVVMLIAFRIYSIVSFSETKANFEENEYENKDFGKPFKDQQSANSVKR